MLNGSVATKIHLAPGATDMRLGMDGLSALARSRLGLDPLSGHLILFRNRRGDRLKILVWDRNGFVLYYKRLSQGRFRLPRIAAGAERVEMDATTLAMLLDGIDVELVARPTRWTPPSTLTART